MQKHRYAVIVDGTPPEVWQLFWYRGPRRPTSSGVSIEILHPGDAVGEGLVRHCTFRVPRYLMSGGVGKSWEWLTEVEPPVSWKYDAVGKPLWSDRRGAHRARGPRRRPDPDPFHRDLPRLQPGAAGLLERRVHHFISKDNDRLITTRHQRRDPPASRRPGLGGRAPGRRAVPDRRIVTARNLSGPSAASCRRGAARPGGPAR